MYELKRRVILTAIADRTSDLSQHTRALANAMTERERSYWACCVASVKTTIANLEAKLECEEEANRCFWRK